MTRVLACVFTVALLAGKASANLYDLTYENATETINGAIFTQIDPSPTGTGVLEPFLRLQKKPNEEGYNTSAGVPLDDKASKWTHAIQVGNFVDVGGYFEFVLDLNEDDSAKHPNTYLITMDRLQLYVSPSQAPVIADNDNPVYTDVSAIGTQVWTLGDNQVQLNYDLNAGSGGGDVLVQIPSNLFGTDPTAFLTLYSAFGVPSPSDAGFEEWAGRLGASVVPLPGAVILGMLGMGAAGWRLRRFA